MEQTPVWPRGRALCACGAAVAKLEEEMQAGLEQLKSHGLPSGVVHEHTPNTLWSLRCSGKGGGDADVTGRGGGHLRDRRDQMSGLLNKVKL